MEGIDIYMVQFVDHLPTLDLYYLELNQDLKVLIQQIRRCLYDEIKCVFAEGSEFPRKGQCCSCEGRAAPGKEAAAGIERRDELQLKQAELQVGRGQLLVSVVGCIFTIVVDVSAGKGVGANAIEERLLRVEAVVHEPAEYAVRWQPQEHEEHGRRGGGRGRVQLQDGALDHHGFRL
jgi:hypothetical protein